LQDAHLHTLLPGGKAEGALQTLQCTSRMVEDWLEWQTTIEELGRVGCLTKGVLDIF